MKTCTCHSCLLENKLEEAHKIISRFDKVAGSTLTINDPETGESRTFYTTPEAGEWLKAKLEGPKV